MDLSIVIPTYNERENILKLIKAIEENLKGIDYEIIIVDDYSPDGTGKIVSEYAKKDKKVKLFQKEKEGLGAAVRYGFSKAKGDILIVMDADFSHPPEKIIEIYNKIKEGFDIVVGSRKVKGGKVVNWPLKRKIISWVATTITRILFRLEIKDPMSGFFGVRKEVLSEVKLQINGFKILLDLLSKTKGKKRGEIPITFEDRKEGHSKMNTKEIFNLIKTWWVLLFKRVQ